MSIQKSFNRLARFSPFAFDTLTEIRWPYRTFLLLLLFLFLLYREYRQFDDCSNFINIYPGSAISAERQSKPKRTEILLGGTSITYHSIDASQLESYLGQPVSCMCVPGGNPWISHHLLKKYPRETSRVRLILQDIDPYMFRIKRQPEHAVLPWLVDYGPGKYATAFHRPKSHYLYLKDYWEWDPPNDEWTFSPAERWLPFRQSVKSLARARQRTRTYAKERETDKNQFGALLEELHATLGPPLQTEQRVNKPFRRDNRDKSVVRDEEFRGDIVAFRKAFGNLYLKADYQEKYLRKELSKPAQGGHPAVENDRRNLPDEILYEKRAERILLDYVDYCESKGIFILFHFPPLWKPFKGRCPGIRPDWDTYDDLGELRFLLLLEELKKRDNCAVVDLDAYQSLYPDRPTEFFMRDHAHSIPNGKVVYTRWLAEQMSNDPKISTALRCSRESDVLFAWKYIKKTAGFVKNQFKRQTFQSLVSHDVK